MTPQISLFASAVRPKLWPAYFKSLEKTRINIEVVFAGNADIPMSKLLGNNVLSGEYNPDFYITTGAIKPSQCYSIASRECSGETISWSCDDAEYPNDVLDKAYNYWKSKNNDKLILSIQTKESGENTPQCKLFNMNEHRFFSWVPSSPLMAPMCLMSRKFFNELGGIDQRYVAGQYENDIVMRAYAQGAKVEIFGGEDCYIEIDHLRKSIEIGESTNEKDFLERPFATGYAKDREILENSWTTFNERDVYLAIERGERPLTLRQISPVQLDDFQPYPENIPLDYSISNKGKWL